MLRLCQSFCWMYYANRLGHWYWGFTVSKNQKMDLQIFIEKVDVISIEKILRNMGTIR